VSATRRFAPHRARNDKCREPCDGLATVTLAAVPDGSVLAWTMVGRFLTVSIAGLVFAAQAVAANSIDDAPQQSRLRLICTGMMVTPAGGKGESRTAADGVVDFAGRRVMGFGIGSAPFVRVTDRRIDFATAKASSTTLRIEGTIDRVGGETRIDVYTGEGGPAAISMRLDCGFRPFLF